MTDNQILAIARKLMKKYKVAPTTRRLEEMGITRGKLRQNFGTLEVLHDKLRNLYPVEWQNCEDHAEKEGLRHTIMKAYKALSLKLDRPPTVPELSEEVKCSLRSIHTLFGTMSKVHEASINAFPEDFAQLFSSDDFTDVRLEANAALIKKHKRFIISTVVSGCKVGEPHLASLLKYAEVNNALPIFLPIADPARPGINKDIMFFDMSLKDHVFIYDNISLNRHCHISNILLSAKQITPTTGLKRLGARSGTFIYASPKLSSACVANNKAVPRMVITPGALTTPDYHTDKYMSNRTAYIAAHDHTMGCIVVDLVDDSIFHWRPVEFGADGSMCDLGLKYTGKSVKKAKVAAIVYPDLHVAECDSTAVQVYDEIITHLNPEYIVIHDSFDGLAVNPHNRAQHNTRAKHSHVMSVVQEGKEFTQAVNKLHGMASKGVRIVASNHPERLDRWIESGAYVYDPTNYVIGHQLALAKHAGEDPLTVLSQMCGISPGVIFMARDESFEVGINPVELAYHGDQGAHGSKGGMAHMDEVLGRCMIGHSHVPGILRRAWSVGTASTLRQGWNKGPSAWAHTIGVVYEDGSRQLITGIEGTWRVK